MKTPFWELGDRKLGGHGRDITFHVFPYAKAFIGGPDAGKIGRMLIQAANERDTLSHDVNELVRSLREVIARWDEAHPDPCKCAEKAPGEVIGFAPCEICSARELIKPE